MIVPKKIILKRELTIKILHLLAQSLRQRCFAGIGGKRLELTSNSLTNFMYKIR